MLNRLHIVRRQFRTSIVDTIFRLDGPGTKYFDKAYGENKPNQGMIDLQVSSSFSDNQVQTTKLDNGVRVVTRANNVPGQIHMGMLLDVGARDETAETSGSLHSIKVTKYKTALQTNETVNYGMVQMSGGKYDMTYDREVSFYKLSCLDHDVVDLFSMMADCALEPRSILAANVAMNKLSFSHETERKSGRHSDLDDTVMRNIYGDGGLGNALLGDKSNIEHLNAFTLQKFQVENYSPEKLIVSGLGVKNHYEFVELVNEKLNELELSGSLNQRQQAQFREGRIVLPEKSNSGSLVICVESSGWNGAESLTAQLLSTLLGGVEVNHFDSVVKPEGELYDNFYSKNSGVNSVEAFSQTFNDTGFFGLRLNAMAQEMPSASRNLLSSVKNVLQNLTEEQFNAARKRLKVRVTRALDQPEILIEEWSRSLNTFGNSQSPLCENLTNLTMQQFKNNALKLLKGKMNVTAQGGNVEQLPELSELKKLLA